jgi:peptide/nickel transport system ATP-binding protein
VTFSIARSSCFALVGRSGSGKTTIARCIAGLHAPAAGQILLDTQPLPSLPRKRTREQRRQIQIIPQNPDDALNPRQTAAHAISRPLRLLRNLDRHQANVETRRLLEQVRLPARAADRYPAELSGGERQRVAIARALAVQPELVICDEITSALDVSVQAAILNLLSDIRANLATSLLLITHDLGVVVSLADHVVVLEHGSTHERGPTRELLETPNDPHTRRLVAAAPSLAMANSSTGPRSARRDSETKTATSGK